ncbi:hypothetical protein BGX20_007780, partial [Mortierella sp. AD010]
MARHTRNSTQDLSTDPLSQIPASDNAQDVFSPLTQLPNEVDLVASPRIAGSQAPNLPDGVHIVPQDSAPSTEMIPWAQTPIEREAVVAALNQRLVHLRNEYAHVSIRLAHLAGKVGPEVEATRRQLLEAEA